MTFQTVLRLFTPAVIAHAACILAVFLMQRRILYPGRGIRVSGPQRP